MLNPLILAAKAKAILEAYQRMHGKDQKSKMINEVSRQHWYPPSTGMHKVNVDAVVYTGQQITGLGVVIRDSQGQVIAAAVKSIKFQEDITVAEAEAVKWGIEVAREAKLMAVIIETDYMDVASLVNNTTNSKKEIVWAISEIQNCKANFQSISVQHVPRCCN